MPNANPQHALVRRALLTGKKVPDSLITLDATCAAGAQCPQVQASPPANQALIVLTSSVGTAHTSLNAKLAAAQALKAATKTLSTDFRAVELALSSYESVVGAVANGDAAIINKAGLLSRSSKVPAVALGTVSVVHTKVGVHPGEAILSWPAGPGATGYAIEVNYTPATPAGPWVALTSGTGRRRVVKTPAPASQLLARVASLGSDGTQSDWSDPVLATTL